MVDEIRTAYRQIHHNICSKISTFLTVQNNFAIHPYSVDFFGTFFNNLILGFFIIALIFQKIEKKLRKGWGEII